MSIEVVRGDGIFAGGNYIVRENGSDIAYCPRKSYANRIVRDREEVRLLRKFYDDSCKTEMDYIQDDVDNANEAIQEWRGKQARKL